MTLTQKDVENQLNCPSPTAQLCAFLDREFKAFEAEQARKLRACADMSKWSLGASILMARNIFKT